MAVKNKTRYAVLGVLSIMSGSGYDIKKFCDKTIKHFWNENFGHIYPVLSKLEKDEFIKIKDINSDNNRNKKIYEITDKGKNEFKKWLLEPVDFKPPRSELLLKISFGNQMGKSKILYILENTRKKYIEKIEIYKLLEKPYLKDEAAKKDKQYYYWLSSLRYGIILTEAKIKWCNETINNLSCLE
ncbi:MAG: PadR family transcriptional regulator [Clostridiales bacterium]